MSCDYMGAKQRAWILAGGGYFFDEAFDADGPDLIAVLGMLPVLAVPKAYEGDPVLVELAFGWGEAELTEQLRGWVALCGIVRRRVADVAAAAAVLLVCLAGAALAQLISLIGC